MTEKSLVPLVPVGDPRNESRVARDFWPKLTRVAARIPFAGDAVAAFYCARDPGTPRVAKATLLAALTYFVVPTDLIPDFIAGLGFSDDAAVLLMVLNIFAGNIKPHHREKARLVLAEILGKDPADI